MMYGLTAGSRIRLHRLSAGLGSLATGQKIISIAQESGYNLSDSCTKALTVFMASYLPRRGKAEICPFLCSAFLCLDLLSRHLPVCGHGASRSRFIIPNKAELTLSGRNPHRNKDSFCCPGEQTSRLFAAI